MTLIPHGSSTSADSVALASASKVSTTSSTVPSSQGARLTLPVAGVARSVTATRPWSISAMRSDSAADSTDACAWITDGWEASAAWTAALRPSPS